QDVIHKYYRACEQLVQEVTGAARVVAFDHNVRSADGKRRQQRIRGGQAVQGPARMAHGDYTLTSAPERLRRLAHEPCGNDTLRSALAPGASSYTSKQTVGSQWVVYSPRESFCELLQLGITLQQVAVGQVADQGIPRRTIKRVQVPAAFAI